VKLAAKVRHLDRRVFSHHCIVSVPHLLFLFLFLLYRVIGLSSISEADSDFLGLLLLRAPVQSNHPRSLAFPNAWDETLLMVGEDEFIADVFQRLTIESFLGCPVVDANGVYINQVDMLDIVLFVCRLFRARQYTANILPSISTSQLLHSLISYVLFVLYRL
jgi:hypothetical protein